MQRMKITFISRLPSKINPSTRKRSRIVMKIIFSPPLPEKEYLLNRLIHGFEAFLLNRTAVFAVRTILFLLFSLSNDTCLRVKQFCLHYFPQSALLIARVSSVSLMLPTEETGHDYTESVETWLSSARSRIGEPSSILSFPLPIPLRSFTNHRSITFNSPFLFLPPPVTTIRFLIFLTSARHSFIQLTNQR